MASYFAPSAQAALPTGGPDASIQKYRWKDSTVAGCPTTPYTGTGSCPVSATASWDEIGLAANVVPFTDPSPDVPRWSGTTSGTSADGCRSIGFTFKYHGTDMACVWAHVDGYVKPVPSSATTPGAAGTAYPTAAMPCDTCATYAHGVIAGMYAWMDERFCNADYFSGAEATPTTHVYSATLGAAGSQRFVIEYKGLVMNYRTPSPAGASVCCPGWSASCPPGGQCTSSGSAGCVWSTFEIVFYEGSNNIDVLHKDISTHPNAPGATAPTNTNNYVTGMDYNPSYAVASGCSSGSGCGLGYEFSTAGGVHVTGRSVRFYPNHGPTCTTPDVVLNEDPASATSFTMTATDPDGDTFSGWNVLTAPTHGALWSPPVGTLTPPGAAGSYPSLTASATRTYLPAPQWNSDPSLTTPETVTYETTDVLGAVSTPSCTLKFKVNAVNDAPVFTLAGPPTATAAVGAFTTLAGWGTGVAPALAAALDEAGAVAAPYPTTPQEVSFALQPHWVGGPVTSTNWPNSVFTSLPTLVRMNGAVPSLTQGTNADLSFVGASAGTWRACFRAVDNGGTAFGGVDTSTNTECIDIVVSGSGGGVCGAPTAAFDLSSTAPIYGESISFTDKSTEVGGSIASWSWDFGDGAKAATKDTVHAYGAPGNYVVRLIVTDQGGCQAFLDKAVQVIHPGGGLGGGDSGSGKPAAYAGEDQTVKETAAVALSGSVNGADPGVTTFAWKQVLGEPVVLANSDTPNPSFTAPALADPNKPIYLMFGLQVSANNLDSLYDYVQVTVVARNQRPIAQAGTDILEAVRGHVAMVDASGSSDPDGDAISYRWTQIAGPHVNGFPATTAKAEFTVPEAANEPFADFQLVVSDGILESADTVRVWFVDAARPADFTVRLLPDGSFEFTSLTGCNDCIWDFGDQQIEVGKAVVRHVYDRPGNYTVSIQQPHTGLSASRSVAVVEPDAPAAASDAAGAATTPWLLWALVLAGVLVVGGAVGTALWLRRRKQA